MKYLRWYSNAIEYHRLIESNTLDPWKGSHIVDKISKKEEAELNKKYSGC